MAHRLLSLFLCTVWVALCVLCDAHDTASKAQALREEADALEAQGAAAAAPFAKKAAAMRAEAEALGAINTEDLDDLGMGMGRRRKKTSSAGASTSLQATPLCSATCVPDKAKNETWAAKCNTNACKGCTQCDYCHHNPHTNKLTDWKTFTNHKDGCYQCPVVTAGDVDAAQSSTGQSCREGMKNECTKCHTECGDRWTPSTKATKFESNTWNMLGNCFRMEIKRGDCRERCKNTAGKPPNTEKTYICAKVCQGMSAITDKSLPASVKGVLGKSAVWCNLHKVVDCRATDGSDEAIASWATDKATFTACQTNHKACMQNVKTCTPCPDRNCTATKEISCATVCKAGAKNKEKAKHWGITEQTNFEHFSKGGERDGPVKGACDASQCKAHYCAPFGSTN